MTGLDLSGEEELSRAFEPCLKHKSSRMLALLLYYVGEGADHAIENQRTQSGTKKSRLFLSTGQGKPYSMGTSKASQIKSHNIR